MSGSERHVREVRLRGRSGELLRRGAILLEDALHTASLPEGEGRRVVAIRRLDVGTISARQSPATLALSIEERVRLLSGRAVHAGDPAAARHAVVFFRDPFEPYAMLAERLATDEDASAWFWPIAVRAWQPSLPRDMALRGLVHAVTNGPAGVVGAVSMVNRLEQRQVAEALLGALTWHDGRTLLRASGWTEVTDSDREAAFESETGGREWAQLAASRWAPLVERWVSRWGPLDARSVWLVCLVLVALKPSRVLEHQLSKTACDLVERFAARVRAVSARTQEGARSKGGSAPVEASARSRMTHASSKDRARDTAAKGKVRDLPSFGDRLSAARRRRPVTAERGVGPSFDGARHTDYAGLFFVLGIMEHLGMSEMLAAHPAFIEADFVAHLFQALCHLLEVPEDDPVIGALPTATSECQVVLPSVVPPRWSSLCVRTPWKVSTPPEPNGHFILWDRSARLVLAVWRGGQPRQVEELIGDRPLEETMMEPVEDVGALLLNSWMTAVRRWCRRFVWMGLKELIRHPGQVALTRTHLDVLFDIEDADVKVRKAGLDISPGWVPWLGRVVLFHYLDGGRRDDE